MKRLLAIAVLLLAVPLAALARDTFQGALAAQAAPHPSLYSFADVYRLTVGAQVLPLPLSSTETMRVAVAQPAPAAEPQFSFSVREPQRWALLAAGLLLAAWVARRRIDAVL